VIAGLAFHTAVNRTRRFMASIWRASSGAPVALLVRPHTPHPRCWPDFESKSPRSCALTLEGNFVNSASQGDGSQPKLPRVALASGLIAALVAAGAVSWATPDGNLVVTLVPALAVGLAVFGLVLWRSRRGESE